MYIHRDIHFTARIRVGDVGLPCTKLTKHIRTVTVKAETTPFFLFVIPFLQFRQRQGTISIILQQVPQGDCRERKSIDVYNSHYEVLSTILQRMCSFLES